jgi:hypothetical protein
MSVQIVDVPLDEITPYARNPRLNIAAIEAVAASIRSYGMVQPLVLDEAKVIVVGDTRYRALQGMGASHAPCVIRAFSPQQAKAYRLADNKTAELATWNDDLLRAEMQDLPQVELSAFFSEKELLTILGSLAPLPGYSDAGTAMRVRGEALDQVQVDCPKCALRFFVNRKDLAAPPGPPPSRARRQPRGAPD